MQLANLRLNDKAHSAIIEGDLAYILPDHRRSMVGLIESGTEGLAEIAALRKAGKLISMPLAGASLAPAIDLFRRDVLCTGWNYWTHFEEGRGKRDGQEAERPKAPTFFGKSPFAIIGPNDDIGIDLKLSEKWDYEAEIAVIIGKAGRSIPRARALDHVFGFCLANDVSLRDIQRRHGGQWLKGKSIDGTTPLGPKIVIADSVDIANLRFQCILNGTTMQDASVSQMAFPIDELIAELSSGMMLRPGDVILTGTPSGVGYARTPPVHLAVGDEVVVQGGVLGELRNKLVPADLAGAFPATTET